MTPGPQSRSIHPRLQRIGRVALFCLALLGLLLLIAQRMPPRGVVVGENPFRSGPQRRPLIIAHAGGKGNQPENTLPAFAASAALGCDMLETDLRLTKDDVLVTHHDPGVERNSNGQGLVRDLTLAQLKVLNFGAHFKDPSGRAPYVGTNTAQIATLDEILSRYEGFLLTLELKDKGETGLRAARSLAARLAVFRNARRVLVASFDDATLDAFRRESGGRIATSTARKQTTSFVLSHKSFLGRAWPGGADALQLPVEPAEASGFRLATARLIRDAHDRNVAVHYWTVNDPESMRALIRIGADGIITDYPDRLRTLLKELGW